MGPGRDSRVDQLLDVFGQISLLRELAGELAGLSLGGNLASQEKPQHALCDDLLATRSRSESLLAVRDSQAMETDALDETGSEHTQA